MEILTRTINIINRCTNLYRDTQLEADGLPGCQVPYILRVCRQPGQTQDELAQGLHVHKSSVARKLAALEANGWITRTPCSQDRRALRVYPTEKAEAALPQLRKMLREWSDYLTASLKPEEAETLLALLNRVADRAESWAAERSQD